VVRLRRSCIRANLLQSSYYDWTFIAARYDATAGTAQFTVNGTNYASLIADPGSGLTNTTIGRNPNFDFLFVGAIDNVFFYNEYLADAQISNIYTNGVSTAVPEPSTIVMTLAGMATLAHRIRKNRKSS
jgi:Concanavalin A-like lectin/glucanases superfamily/PEP-CTERM motif